MAIPIDELDRHISKHIQGVFGKGEMEVMKAEIEKLQPRDIYVEIGVDEGRSARVAHEYAHPEVYKLFIDIHDPQEHSVSMGRAKFMEQEDMVGLGKRGFHIHGDADEFAALMFGESVSLLYIDGHHDYESVKNNTLRWERYVKIGGAILFHDYDHPETRAWLDEHYGNNKKVFYDKIVLVKRTYGV